MHGRFIKAIKNLKKLIKYKSESVISNNDTKCYHKIQHMCIASHKCHIRLTGNLGTMYMES